jgi:hypothetical protein
VDAQLWVKPRVRLIAVRAMIFIVMIFALEMRAGVAVGACVGSAIRQSLFRRRLPSKQIMPNRHRRRFLNFPFRDSPECGMPSNLCAGLYFVESNLNGDATAANNYFRILKKL